VMEKVRENARRPAVLCASPWPTGSRTTHTEQRLCGRWIALLIEARPYNAAKRSFAWVVPVPALRCRVEAPAADLHRSSAAPAQLRGGLIVNTAIALGSPA
jgi:hypothetical protein